MKNVPKDRAAAQILANEFGLAYYGTHTKGTSHWCIWAVNRGTPPPQDGERVVNGNSWTRYEAEKVVESLNNAFQTGMRYGDGTLH